MDIVTKIDGSRMQIPRVIVGGSQEFSWISSGNVASVSNFAVYNGDETAVASVTATHSGSGLFYVNAVINTPGFYVAQWSMTYNGSLYKRRDIFQAVLMEVD